MRFDRKAPGEGIEAVCNLENGRAALEWRFFFAEDPGAAEDMGLGATDGDKSCSCSKKSWIVRLMLIDMQGNMVLEGIQSLWEEEPLRSVVLQPRLWRGLSDPYLYRLEAVLEGRDGSIQDRISRMLPLRTFSGAEHAGEFSLNGESFESRVVSYTPPSAVSQAEFQRLATEDFRQMLRLGANSVCVKGAESLKKFFVQLCDRLGFLLFYGEREERGCAHGGNAGIGISWKEAPVFRGERDSLFVNGSKTPTSLFYRYMARWSGEPFVYLVPESVEELEDGNYSVRCYSNCERIALYSDGILFEFQKGDGEFLFREVPAKTPSIMLTAEGDGCSSSLSISRSYCRAHGRKR